MAGVQHKNNQHKDADRNLVRPEGVPGGAIAAEYEAHTDEGHDHHIVPMSTYYKIFGALMGLLLITVLAAEVDMANFGMPWMNIIIALAIAVTKAVLIVLYFMHVKFSSRLIKICAAVAYFFLMIMFTLTYADYFTRNWINNAGH
ncbi:MAG: cytochrome c oxidase subunit [Abditibacteriota bacterium]|jgi:cytochrome c oxidase subunit 4|nr:cytochrome c oxidase subunit [Abditibacteriota bacterium]